MKIKLKSGSFYEIVDSNDNTLLKVQEDGTIIGVDTCLISTTYSELKTLRDNSQLIPGMYYRITDYVTTTAQADTRSAGHQFDIIVRALSESKLSDEAFAIQHEGDTYFANSKLSAWKLWYCLENDTTRFGWADSVNGKGVIYRMIDEFDNDIPYDFKNVIYVHKVGFTYNQWGQDYAFVRDSSLDADGYYGWRCDRTPSAWSNPYCFTNTLDISTSMTLYSDTSGSAISFGGSITSINSTETENYTFNYRRQTESESEDVDVSLNKFCYNNKIEKCKNNSGIQQLNSIYAVMHHESQLICNNIIFGINCNNITFDGGCYNNTFGDECKNIKFRGISSQNTFGNRCSIITFGASCSDNTFGNGCYNNIFGNNCRYNTFGDECTNNTFGNQCSGNTLDSICQNITFGDECSRNTFGIACYNNIFGNTCYGNTFGDYCSNNVFGSDPQLPISYVRLVIVDSGCCFLNIISDDIEPSGNNYLQNVHIHLGVSGTESLHKTITIPDRNLPYSTEVYATGTTEMYV